MSYLAHDSTMVMRLLCSRSATDPGGERHFGRSVHIILPAPLKSSCEMGRRMYGLIHIFYNHQVGPARGRPADFPRLLGGALVRGAAPLDETLELGHDAAAPLLQQPGHRAPTPAGRGRWAGRWWCCGTSPAPITGQYSLQLTNHSSVLPTAAARPAARLGHVLRALELAEAVPRCGSRPARERLARNLTAVLGSPFLREEK